MKFSLPLKITYTLFVVVLVPIYGVMLGPQNFLWFSDIALIATVFALWWENKLLASMMLLCAGFFDIIWLVDLLGRLILGVHLIGGTEYMFGTEYPRFLLNLSLFHVFLPPVLILMVARLGYAPEAFRWQSLVAAVIFIICFFFTSPEHNVNWVFGPGQPQETLHPYLYLLTVMLVVPAGIYLPCHLLLRKLFPVPPND